MNFLYAAQARTIATETIRLVGLAVFVIVVFGVGLAFATAHCLKQRTLPTVAEQAAGETTPPTEDSGIGT